MRRKEVPGLASTKAELAGRITNAEAGDTARGQIDGLPAPAPTCIALRDERCLRAQGGDAFGKPQGRISQAPLVGLQTAMLALWSPS